ncbi:hypothetical protein Salpa_4898 [Sporomusa sp. KB1]|jgi:hypothetical protein|nr:hypothetical protein Salpa_4898 [Sporomusa sp. KB1]
MLRRKSICTKMIMASLLVALLVSLSSCPQFLSATANANAEDSRNQGFVNKIRL